MGPLTYRVCYATGYKELRFSNTHGKSVNVPYTKSRVTSQHNHISESCSIVLNSINTYKYII